MNPVLNKFGASPKRPHNTSSQKQAPGSIILLNVNDTHTYTNIKKVLPDTNDFFEI